MSEGVKHDDGKPRCDLLPAGAMLAVSNVLGFGARKYAPNNWRLVPDAKERYIAAALRHLFAHMMGEKHDQESGLTHLSHAATCLLFVIDLENDA